MGLIPAGLMRQQLTVLRATRTSNGAGGWTNTWASVGTVNGSVTARERGNRDEDVEAMQPTELEVVDILADGTVVTIGGKDRIEDPDGRTYELLTLTRQGPLVKAVGRSV